MRDIDEKNGKYSLWISILNIFPLYSGKYNFQVNQFAKLGMAVVKQFDNTRNSCVQTICQFFGMAVVKQFASIVNCSWQTIAKIGNDT